MATPPLKAQKIFALMQIIGGFVAALVLGYSTMNNLTPGQMSGTQLLLACLTLAALAYAGYFTQKLGKLVAQEKAARDQ
ncbi:hypothetical protein AZSI13_28850 [Azospira sp. I13]|uniref:hypothetical protein n=1 Tax=Azospira sp. I13 TaxID=1765050 RepID=UPI000D4C0EB2|nr:hypothetical protein [Azospira sp. I13]GBG03558.1 hypothetical protein AZSI13_28850 [Azospira sp. I13]